MSEIDYNDIDIEIRELVRTLNSLSGVKTTSSCFGHGLDVCRIWFTVKDIHTLHKLLFCSFNGVNTWRIELDNADVHRYWYDIPCVLCSTSKNINKLLEQIPILIRNFTQTQEDEVFEL